MLEKEETIQSGTDKRAALKALVENGRDVFVERGYHATRVDDLAAAAGVSHGVFYRYFENKDELAIVLTVQAMRAVAEAFVEIPDLTTRERSGTASVAPALQRGAVGRGGDDPCLGRRRTRGCQAALPVRLGVGLGAAPDGAGPRRPRLR